MEKKIHNKLLLLNEIVFDYIKPEENSKRFGELRFNQICVYGKWHYAVIFGAIEIAYTEKKILNFDKESAYMMPEFLIAARHEICEAVAKQAEQKYLANQKFA